MAIATIPYQEPITQIDRTVTNMDYIRLLFAFIVPPVSVYIQFGFGKLFWINFVLTLFGFIPGMLHAVYVMAANPPGLTKL